MALINTLNDIGNAIREKTGGTELIPLKEMASAIQGISSGIELIDHTVTFTVDGEPYEIVSVKDGNSVNAPFMEDKCIKWLDTENKRVIFPYVPKNNITLSAKNTNETLLLKGENFIDVGCCENVVTNNGVAINTTLAKFESGSFHFDSATDYLQMSPDNFRLGTNDFTIDFWLYNTSTNSSLLMGCWGSTESETDWAVNIPVTSIIQFMYRLKGISATQSFYSDTGALRNNVWQHIAITRKDNTLYLFVDGALVASSTIVGNTIQSGSNNFRIGQQLGEKFNLNCYMDEIRIINGECMWTENFTPPKMPY